MLRPIVGRCIAEDRDKRFADAADIAAELERSVRKRRARRIVLAILAGLVGLAAVGASAMKRDGASTGPIAHKVGSARVLISNAGDAPVRDISLSPTGDSLAYVESRGLFVADVNSEQTQQVLAAADLTCVRWLGGNVLVDRETGATQPLGLEPGCAEPSPDGHWLVVGARHGGKLELYRWDRPAAPEHVRQIVSARQHWLISNVAWSPDSARIAYLERPLGLRGHGTLHTLEVSTGARAVASSDPRAATSFGLGAFAWRSAHNLWFAIEPRAPFRDQPSSLHEVVIEAGRATRVDPPQPVGQGESWTNLGFDRDRRRLAYQRFSSERNVFVGQFSRDENGHPRSVLLSRLSMSERGQRPSAWARDGQSLWLVSEDAARHHAARLDLSGVVRERSPRSRWITWPVVTARGDVLAWELDVSSDLAQRGRITAQTPVELVQLVNGRVERYRHVPRNVPVPRRYPPPRELRIRCASEADACVLAHLGHSAAQIESTQGDWHVESPGAFEDLRLSADGAELTIFGRRGGITTYDRDGNELRRLGPSAERCKTRGGDLDPVSGGYVVARDCPAPPRFRLDYVSSAGDEHGLWSSETSMVGHPQVTPAGDRVAVLLMQFTSEIVLRDVIEVAD